MKDVDAAQLRQTLSEFQPFETQINSASIPTDEAKQIAQRLNSDRAQLKSRFEGWASVQDAIALAHEGVEFRRAGAIPYDLFRREFGTEKAVDVKLAVDLSCNSSSLAHVFKWNLDYPYDSLV